jgi:hypothetical protein
VAAQDGIADAGPSGLERRLVERPGAEPKVVGAVLSATVNNAPVTRPTRVIAPAPAKVNCATAPLTTRGCQVLTYTYAPATTATASVNGDYLGRLKQLSYTAYNPATAAMATVALARYSYDSTGRLRAA